MGAEKLRITYLNQTIRRRTRRSFSAPAATPAELLDQYLGYCTRQLLLDKYRSSLPGWAHSLDCRNEASAGHRPRQVTTITAEVAKKAFDVVARNSLRGITDILSERFKGNAEVLRLRDELELKVDVLSLPVDICVQHALQGNSALQGALNVALRVLQDIEDYEANLRQQEIDTARGTGGWTPDKTSVGQAVRKLESLIKQLDSLLPYLGVAINAVNLLNTGPAAPSISPSRLMAASWTLRSSSPSPSKPIFSLPRAIWHRQGLTATASGRTPMQTLYPLCSIALQRSPEEEEQEVDSSSADVGQSPEYELCIQQNMDDGAYHEEDEQAEQFRLKVQDIVAVEWATSHSLGLGANDYTPALVMHVIKPTAGGSSGLSSGSASVGSTAATAATPPPLVPTPTTSSSTSKLQSGRRRSIGGAPSPPHAGPQRKFALQLSAPEDTPQDIACSSSQWKLLSQFEYLVRLCMLESREETPHYQLGDERIQMAFNSTSSAFDNRSVSPSLPDLSPSASEGHLDTPRLSSHRRAAQSSSGFPADSPSGSIVTVTKNLESMGFGSPT
ncbi:hypothetical protein WJX77_012220 [Trebouxia sp. C0004]